MSLNNTPQRVSVKLVPLDGSPVYTSHYSVDMLLFDDGSEIPERFVSSDRQSIPLSGCREHKPGDILSPASSTPLRVP